MYKEIKRITLKTFKAMKGIWIAKVELMDSFDKVVYTEISKVYAHESYEAYNKVTELNGYPEYN